MRNLGRGTAQGDLRFVHVLEQMGCDVELANDWTEVRGPDHLRGLTVDMADLPDMALTLAAIGRWLTARSASTALVSHAATKPTASARPPPNSSAWACASTSGPMA